MARKINNTHLVLEGLEARRLLTTVWADFNNDGFDDLAIGVPGEDSGAGMVQVLRGSATGLSATGSQSFTQATLGTDLSEAGDNFGASLAAGDYNNDGFSDLAVGVPGEDVGATGNAGLVHFILGSATGLTGAGDYVMHKDTNRVRDIAGDDDFFGTSLAAGDFDNDGFVDLGVGVPGQDIAGKVDAGGIHIFYGGGTGIKPPRNQPFNLDGPIPGVANKGDTFGSALASGDFNSDGHSDLAIGAPKVDDVTLEDAGAFIVMYGSNSGITSAGSQFWNQDTAGVPDNTESGDLFGSSLAAGDFNNDGRSDLAIGAPSEDITTTLDAGGVTILIGSATGLTAIGSTMFSQGTLGGGNVEQFDFWGSSLTSGDFNGGFDDLAIGAPGETIGGVANAGTVNVMFGSGSGLTVIGHVTLTQESLGGTSEADDRFGDTLGAGDFNGDGKVDLAVGVPNEDVGEVANAGTVYVGYGATFTGGQTWTQDTAGIFDTAETGDGFGGGLDANGSKSAPGGGGRADLGHLITADAEVESLLNKTNKRRQLGGRR